MMSRFMNNPTPREILGQEIQQLIDEGQQLIDEQNQQVASILVEAGLHLVPCEGLSDHTVMVSPRVYEVSRTLNK
jgi:hypothetical protein